MSDSLVTAEELGRELLRRLKAKLGIEETAPAYLVWSQNPAELPEAGATLLSQPHLSPEERERLGAILKKAAEKGYNLVAILSHQGQFRWSGVQLPLKVAAKA